MCKQYDAYRDTIQRVYSICANSMIASVRKFVFYMGKQYKIAGVLRSPRVLPQPPTASSHSVDDGVRAETIDRDRRARA